MAYRRTQRETARLAARHEAIVAAARRLACESGLGAVQIAPVAERAGIAAGTVYRYFPSKDDLVAAVVSAATEREVAAIRAAAAAAPGALSGLAAAIMAFASGTLRARRLAFAMLSEEPPPCLPRLPPHPPPQSAEGKSINRSPLAGEGKSTKPPPLAGEGREGVGPLAPAPAGPEAERAAVQEITLFALRALGVADARARGLVMSVASNR